MGGTEEKYKNRSSSFSDWNSFSLRFRKCTPLATLLNVPLKVRSVLTGKRANEDCYLFPVQQLRSSLVTWIPLCFGYASACAPVYTHTHKNKALSVFLI